MNPASLFATAAATLLALVVGCASSPPPPPTRKALYVVEIPVETFAGLNADMSARYAHIEGLHELSAETGRFVVGTSSKELTRADLEQLVNDLAPGGLLLPDALGQQIRILQRQVRESEDVIEVRDTGRMHDVDEATMSMSKVILVELSFRYERSTREITLHQSYRPARR